MNHPLIIATIAADQLREQHERAARTRTAREIRRTKQREAATGRSSRSLFAHRALRAAA